MLQFFIAVTVFHETVTLLNNMLAFSKDMMALKQPIICDILICAHYNVEQDEKMDTDGKQKKKNRRVKLAEEEQDEERNVSDKTREMEERRQKAEEGRQYVAELLAKHDSQRLAKKDRRRRARESRRASRATKKG